MKRKCFAALVVCFLLFVYVLPRTAGAESIDQARTCALTVELLDGGVPVEGVPFELFYVASVSAQGEFTLAGDFQDSPVEVNGLTEAQYAELAQILDAYARQNGLTPLAQTETGPSGSASFGSLKPGLYLVGGSSAVLDGKRIAVDAFLVCLPGKTSDGALTYQVTAQPKHSTSIHQETVTRRVWKTWDDAGFTRRRPGSVTVELLCDGEVYDTRVLTAGNSWQYVWKALPAWSSAGKLHNWTLREQAVQYYDGVIWAEGDTFLVRNTYVGKKLPQTGQLWWPVTGMSAAGLGFMTVGFFLKKRHD